MVPVPFGAVDGLGDARPHQRTLRLRVEIAAGQHSGVASRRSSRHGWRLAPRLHAERFPGNGSAGHRPLGYPWGSGGVLIANGQHTSWFASKLDDFDANTLGHPLGEAEGQQTWAAYALLVATRAWRDDIFNDSRVGSSQ